MAGMRDRALLEHGSDITVAAGWSAEVERERKNLERELCRKPIQRRLTENEVKALFAQLRASWRSWPTRTLSTSGPSTTNWASKSSTTPMGESTWPQEHPVYLGFVSEDQHRRQLHGTRRWLSRIRSPPEPMSACVFGLRPGPPQAITPGAAFWSCSTACYACLMAREITQRELRNNSGEIMRQLDHGETFIVTRNGAPVGELTPLRRHRFVMAVMAVDVFRMAPPLDFDRFRADLDAVADQDPTPRG